jgi:cytoskeletal protein RodZ
MTSDRPPGDFGGRLRAARERRGISLRQIANSTKISVAALEALERNDVSRLPGGIFSRAFVRSYAAEVGLDPDETVQEFLAHFPQTAPTGHDPVGRVEDGEALESDRRTASTFLRLIAFSIPIAVAVLYFGTSGRLSSDGSAQRGDAGDSSAVPPASAPAVEPEPAVNAPKTRPAPAAEAPARANVPAAAQGRPASPPVATSMVAAPDALQVELTVTRPCWLSATVDGEKKIDRLLQAGDRETFAVSRELSFTAGDASGVKMTINGAGANPLGREGQVVTARVTPTNFKTYLPVK